MLISVLIFGFLFAACEQTTVSELDLERIGSDILTPVDNNNPEDEGNEKKPTIVVPPETNPGNKEVQSIPFQVGAISNSMSSRNNHNLFTIVRSKEELDLAASERYHQYWTGTGGPYNVDYLAEITEKYDEDFFIENALVLYLFVAGNSGGKIDITRMQRQDNELTIITDFHMGALTAISYWTVVIEVAQTDVYGITVLESKNECDCSRFSFDLILVVLTHEATVAAYHANKTYTPADFPEFNFSKVENLFTMMPTGPQFKRLLFLYLSEPSKENVLRSIELIGQRPDVESAEPNYILGF